jgi:hypothetical protein
MKRRLLGFGFGFITSCLTSLFVVSKNQMIPAIGLDLFLLFMIGNFVELGIYCMYVDKSFFGSPLI